MKLTHVASTIWFMVCVGYILVLTLHEVGFKWWLIFSLSGHSAVAVGVLISVYLFALVRDMGGSQQIQVEHPFTSTHSYMGFYVAAPLLGGLAGIFGMIGASDLSRYADGVARGTLGTTFFVWVVLDPVTGLIEIAAARQPQTSGPSGSPGRNWNAKPASRNAKNCWRMR